jgi:hypothetical protein
MDNKKSLSAASPFGGNVLAMKDVKDKTTRKGSLRPLFDCVEAINAAVDALQTFVETSPEDKDSGTTAKMLETLTSMQIKLLEMSKERIQKQNVMQNQMAPMDMGGPPDLSDEAGAQPAPDLAMAAKSKSAKKNG